MGTDHERLDANTSSDDCDRPHHTELILYEEAMCCSAGVCGPDPDDELVEVSAVLGEELAAAKESSAEFAFTTMVM